MFTGSLRNKLMLLMLIATVVPLATSILITHLFTQERLSEKAVKDNSNLLYQGKTNLVNYLQTMQLMPKSIYNNEPLMEILKNRTKNFFSEMELYNTEREILMALHAIEFSLADVRQIYLYSAQADRSYLYNKRLIIPDADGSPYRQPFVTERQSEVIPPHPMHTYGKSYLQTSKPQVITFHHALYDLFPKTALGTLSIDISTDTIKRIAEELYTRGEEELYIIDAAGSAIYAPDAGIFGQQLTDPWIRRLQQETKAGVSNSFRMEDGSYAGIYIFENIHLPYLDWTIVKRIPDSILYKTERQLSSINLVIGLIFLIVAMIVTVFISIKMTAPIGQLIGYINKIKLGNMNVDIQMNRNDELGTLALRFKSMMHTINELVLKEYKLEVANKTNELKALQAQINPHFLNNALQSIGALALQQQNREVYSLISSLGRMMRYSMNTDETMVPLKSEVDYVKAYLKLQKQRFRNQFDEQIEVEPETEQLLIPKMIIQPLAENYFKHGFMGGNEENRIRIRCFISPETDKLHIEVCDNGFGIGEEELKAMRRRLEDFKRDASDPSEHIGLVNVLSRLNLYYREYAQMTVERAEPQGFRVVLIIPVSHTEGGV